MQINTPKNNLFYRLWKNSVTRLLTIHDKPRDIALGMALGLFIAMTPTFGFQMALAVFLATVFKWNKVAALIGVWLTNPLTVIFIYGLCYRVGAFFYAVPRSQSPPTGSLPNSVYDLLLKAPDFLIALTIGSIVIGLPLAVVGYLVTHAAVYKYQQDLKRKLSLKKLTRRKKKKKKKRKKPSALKPGAAPRR
jgi:uncharacterized protein (TIGR03546 family)